MCATSPAISPSIARWTCGPTVVAVECTVPVADSKWNSVDPNVHAVDYDRTCCLFYAIHRVKLPIRAIIDYQIIYL